MARPFLTARWQHLVMLNYAIDPAALAPYLPGGCELDAFHGQHFVSVVGFWFRDTRLLGVPIPWHRDFEEINLRFYVRHQAGPESRRGVVFIKEVVPRRAVATVARWVYNENYVCLPTASNVAMPSPTRVGTIAYRWHGYGPARVLHEVAADIRGEPAQPAPDSEEAFIVEHYWGYSRQRNGGAVEYEVRHPPWRVWRAESPRLACTGFYGGPFDTALARAPTSAFVADGSAVAVMKGRRI